MRTVVFVVGPTASGKTDYAIHIAQRYGGEIVSADSMQVYRHMDIGTAKPTPAQQALVPHHLVDFADPAAPFSVADYKALAETCFDELFARDTLPVVCGGTGLYISALLYDMDFSAAPGQRIERDALYEELAQGDPKALHDQLRTLDPKAAELIHPNNVKRVLRAIERLRSGQESQLQPYTEATGRITQRFKPILIGLRRDRPALIRRIDERVDAFIQQGLVDEVTRLLASGLTAEDTAMKGIGYKELIPHLQGEVTLTMAVESIKIHTRQYAKRQMTWFRRLDGMRWFSLERDECEPPVLEEMVAYIDSEMTR